MLNKNEVYVYKLTLVKEYRPKDKSKYVSLLERHPRFDELYANPEHTELAMHAYREYSLSDTPDGQAFVVYCHIKNVRVTNYVFTLKRVALLGGTPMRMTLHRLACTGQH